MRRQTRSLLVLALAVALPLAAISTFGGAGVLVPDAAAAAGNANDTPTTSPATTSPATTAPATTAPATTAPATTSTGTPDSGPLVAVGSTSGAPNEVVTIPLRATGENVASYEVTLEYDPSLVTVVGVQGADFAEPVWNADPETGQVNLTQTNTDGVTDPTLARVQFELVGDPGTATSVSFVPEATALFDVDSETLSAATDGGTISIASAGGDGDTGGADPGGDSSGGDPGGVSDDDGDDASIVEQLTNQPLVLAALGLILVVLVAGFAYWLGARRSRSPRTNWGR